MKPKEIEVSTDFGRPEQVPNTQMFRRVQASFISYSQMPENYCSSPKVGTWTSSSVVPDVDPCQGVVEFRMHYYAFECIFGYPKRTKVDYCSYEVSDHPHRAPETGVLGTAPTNIRTPECGIERANLVLLRGNGLGLFFLLRAYSITLFPL